MKVVHKLKAVGPKNVALGFIRRVEYGKKTSATATSA